MAHNLVAVPSKKIPMESNQKPYAKRSWVFGLFLTFKYPTDVMLILIRIFIRCFILQIFEHERIY